MTPSDAKLTKAQTHEVTPVGGGTSIRLLQRPGAEQEHQPDEAVAPGAAVVMVVLLEDKCEKVQDLLLLDDVPLFDSGVGNGEVNEGERAVTKSSKLFRCIPPAPRGVPQMEVNVDIDANGILSTSATDRSTGKANKITITHDKGQLSKEEVQRMVRESEQHKAESEVQRDRVAAENFLEVRVFHVKSCLQGDSRREGSSEEDRCKGRDKCEEILAWVEHNRVAGKERTLVQSCCPIFRRLYAPSGVPRGNSTGPQACQERPSTDPIIEEVDRLTCRDKSSVSVRAGLTGVLDF
ncbi:Heat shock 70 kDa protein 6 [Microtus ochrogaster]|uniref:Heat shock 70 kDa protein 6 n=1 Tax=Microtus ochrogaster TaxID=79684 RepID=A0A8J6G922_MICOH|nr:Heat shock 70 kDa protein 6 [Microtus ochrogaster]